LTRGAWGTLHRAQTGHRRAIPAIGGPFLQGAAGCVAGVPSARSAEVSGHFA
jgi:hypothetical protein